MPVTVPVSTSGNRQFEISGYTVLVSTPGAASVRVDIIAQQLDAIGQFGPWAQLPSITLEGQVLMTAMGNAAVYVQQNLAAGILPALAYYAGTKRALYEACQAAKAIPVGAIG